MDNPVIPGITGLANGGAPAADSAANVPPPDVLPAGVRALPSSASAPAGPASSPTSGTPPVDPNAPHAGLRSILQSLFLGMDAFGKSIATGGREGGAQEVEQVRQQRAELGLAQQREQREASLADAQIKHTQALTNATIAQTEVNKINAPLEHQKLVIENQKGLYDLYVNTLHINPLFAVPIVQGQGTDEHMTALNAKANGDLVSHTVIPVHDETVGGAGNSYGFSYDQLRRVNVPIEQAGPLLTNLQNQIDLARETLPNGEKDPAVQAAQGKLDVMKKGASINGFDFFVFDNSLQNGLLQRVSNQKTITEFQEKQAQATKAKQEADPLFKLENNPGEIAGEKSSAAIPLLQGKLADPATSPEDKVRASRLLAVASSAHQRFLQDQVAKSNAEQAAKQGDPRAAGAMLASGNLTLADMKTRGMTPKFILEATAAAQSVDPKYNPADEMIAENVAKSPHQVQFFGSANSLIAKGGTLDQVVEAGAKLPNFRFPLFNKIADAKNYSSGRPEVAAYIQTALGAADDYAKVLGGGAGTEGMQVRILNAMTEALNQNQRVQVVNSMRAAVGSQVKERIGNNKFLDRAYGYGLRNVPGAVNFDPAKDFHPIK